MVQNLAGRQGWLLSDLEMLRITDDGVRLRYKPHGNAPIMAQCFDVRDVYSDPVPCSD